MTADLPNRGALIARLEAIVGAAHVLCTEPEMAPFLQDIRGLYHGEALCVIEPATTAEVSAVMRFCFEERIAVTPIGGNTGLVGGAVPQTAGGIGLSLRRMNRILSVSREDATMVVEAGCILQNLQHAAEARGMLLPISLSAEGSCQIGGNIATNA